LILWKPPPFGGGEMIGLQLERCFRGRYSLLAFCRGQDARTARGRVSVANLRFGVRFVLQGSSRLIRSRPRVLYLDIPKDSRTFLRNSVILLVAVAFRVRVVGDLAGADFQFLHAGSPLRVYGRWLLRRLAAIRVLGEPVAATLRLHGLDNAVVVTNGIDEPPRAVVTRTLGPDLAFLYVGRIAEAKGVLTLLEYMGDLVASGRPGRLHLVGEWESEAFKERVLALLDAGDLHDRVEIHGLLVDEEKWERFRTADVLLHPTRWDGQPVTILEALAFGLPVVATKVGAIPATIRSGVDGYLMSNDTAAEISAGVQAITKDAATYAEFSAQARTSFLDRFTSERFKHAMSKLLERI
jgi:glycosyltransferase involved in cell wall biosynthesis